jgi:hypothetical protein
MMMEPLGSAAVHVTVAAAVLVIVLMLPWLFQVNGSGIFGTQE